MGEEEQLQQLAINGGAEVGGVEKTGKPSAAANVSGKNGVVNGNGHSDDVEGSYIFVGNGNNNAEAVTLEVVPEMVDSADKDLESEKPDITSDRIQKEAITDECDAVAIESIKEAEFPCIDKIEKEIPVSIVEVGESDNNVELDSENQIHPLDSHQDLVGKETAEITSSGNSESLNVVSFDCCCVPVGGSVGKSSPSADDNAGKSVVGEGKNLNVSFDCCSVPVAEDIAESAVEVTAIEDAEGSRVDDEELVAESKTLDVKSNDKDRNMNGEVGIIHDEVDAVPDSTGSHITQDVMESAGDQQIPADDMNEGSGQIDLPEREESNHTSSCGDLTTEILVEGKSSLEADRADKGLYVSGDMNGDINDIMTDGKTTINISDTNKETEGTEESAEKERSMPSGDMRSESIVEEAIDSSMESVDVSGSETVLSAPEAVGNHGVSVDDDDKINCQEYEDIHKDGADKRFDVSEDMNGDIVADGKTPTDISDTNKETESAEESVENERSVPSGDIRSEFVVEEAIDSGMDVSGSDIAVSAPEADGNQGVSVDNDDKINCQESGDVNDAEKSFDVSEDMNGDIIADGKTPSDISVTNKDAEGTDESAKNERSVSSGDTRSDSVVEETIDNILDISGTETAVSAPEAVANQGVLVDNDDKINCLESKDINNNHKDEAEPSSHEVSVVAEVVTRPFYYIVKHPRFEDNNLREQMEVAQLEVDEKTRERDAIRMKIQDMRSTCKDFDDEVEAAISKERGMREILRSKRQEMDSLQSMMIRVKNAISVEDIDGRIHNLQYMIEHETVPLNEEKQLIREINQLKQQRAQLSINVGRGDEVQKAMDEKDKIEERLKALRKEADAIRVKLSKFENDKKSSKNKYSDENKKLSELQAQFRAANDIRQTAYIHLQSLRKQFYEKNKYFRWYKDDIKTIENYISTKKKVELHHHCLEQEESFMDLWNNNAEFRKEYIRCNTRSTLRRLGTMDGRSLGPEEKPPVIPPVIMYNKKFAKVKSVPQTLSLEQEKRVATREAEKIDDKRAMKVEEQKSQTAKSGKSKKSAPMKSVLAVSGKFDGEEPLEVTSKQLEEEAEVARREKELAIREEELARREQERRKEEEAARLKELRRLEEKVKAKEAMERKKRLAEKAQARAALRAQKEAEEREKERERRAKKKEKKKTAAVEATDGSVEAEFPPTFVDQSEEVKEPESKGKPSTVTKKPQRQSHFAKQTKSKSVPLPLRSRSKKRMQSWMWLIVVALLVIAVFLLGNSGVPLPFGLERFGFK